MRLNYKNTSKIGFAFAIVMLFWIGYEFVVPLFLDSIYGLPDSVRGIIMGLDNLLSIFLLPIFGRLSDKTKTKYGRRTPFIFFGTICAVALMVFIPIIANMQYSDAMQLRAEVTASVDSELLGSFYDDAKEGKNNRYCDYQYLVKSGITREYYVSLRYNEVEEAEGKYYLIADNQREEITQSEYQAYLDTNEDYFLYVQAGLNSYISAQVYRDITLKNPRSIIISMIVLFFVLVAMASFRSPAVALMPDVTPKPFRSQANALINLAGGAGGAIAFITYTTWLAVNEHAYIQIFATMGACMLLLLFCFLKLVNEPKMVEEKRMQCLEFNIIESDYMDGVDKESPEYIENERQKKKSFLLILASIFMFFVGFYAIQTNLSIYATRELLFKPSVAGLITAFSMGFSALAFIPVGYLAVKIGRKKSVLIGFSIAITAFFLTFILVRVDTRILFGVFFLLAGIGLIATNVNTFPMVVELSKDGDVGKYTGYYYVAAMSGQAIAPFIGGLFMGIKSEYLFLHATVSIVIAFILMMMVKHGDSRLPSNQPKADAECE